MENISVVLPLRPAKLLHNSGMENGEGIPDGITKDYGDRSYAQDNPAVKDTPPIFSCSICGHRLYL
jgi:hypothetical protein